MAFKLQRDDMVGTAPIEYFNGTAGESFTPGQVLCLSGGAVTKGGVDSAGKQQYLCAGMVDAADVAAKQVPCYRILPGRVYAAPLTVSGTALKVGDKITISADGLGLTATTANGVCEIVHMEGTAIGSRVHIRF